jgi:hypothetical protein
MATPSRRKLIRPGDKADQLAAFAEAALAAAREAERHTAATRLDISVAEIPIRLELCGDTLASIGIAALSGLRSENAHTAARIWAFDTETSGLEPPPPPWGRDAYRPRDALAVEAPEWLEISYGLVPGCLNLFDRHERTGVFWMHDARRLPGWQRTTPLRSLLRSVARRHDAWMLHAAAVANDRAAVLISGRGGSGKSTTAIGCAIAGIECLGDDVCIVRDDRVYPLYGIAKAEPRTVALLSLDRHHAIIGGDDLGRAHLRIADLGPPWRSEGRPVVAVVVPQVSAPAGRLRPLNAAAAVLACGPSTALEITGNGQAEMRFVASLLQRTPAYELGTGGDLTRVVGAISNLLEGVR